ncbi:MAG TPA: ABC transporter ATP-binding protein [Noviherbaspirillum sp.]|nr:ABC transporter ATP-binding protein [Noviherbaspirillum sp.]
MIDIGLTKTLNSTNGPLQLDIRTSVDKGCFLALFGPSGVGKTTILRMLAGLTRPDAGRIIVNGTTWFDSEHNIDLPPQKRAIGFVFQDYALFPNLTVRQNIAYGAQVLDDGHWIDELVHLMELGEFQHRLPGTLSGGQKQRVALARAVAPRPALLLLDEPLSALDVSLRHRLQDDIATLHRSLGLTTVLVSHDIGEVFKLSHKVLRLEQGKIIESGSPAQIFLERKLSGKFNLHAQVLAVRRDEVVYIVSLLIGQDIVEVIASDDEVAELRAGDAVSVSSKAFSPFFFKSTHH